MFPFYIPLKHQKTSGILMLSKEYRNEIFSWNELYDIAIISMWYDVNHVKFEYSGA